MTTPATKSERPWDEGAIEPHLGCLGYGCATVFFSMIVAGIVIFGFGTAFAPLLRSTSDLPTPLDWLGTMAVALIAFAIVFSIARRLNHGHLAYSLRLSESNAKLLFRRANWLTVIEGNGDAVFRDGGMELVGSLRVRDDLVELLWWLPLIVLSSFFKRNPAWDDRYYYLFVVLAVVLVFWRPWRFAIRRFSAALAAVSTVMVLPRHIKRVQCIGATVFIRFVTPPVPGLKRVAFYVSPPFQDEFFQRFDETFPGALPKRYRDYLGAAPKSAGAPPGI